MDFGALGKCPGSVLEKPKEPGADRFVAAQLRIRHGGQELVHKLVGESLTLGKDPANDVVIADPYISSRHLKLLRRHGAFHVVDQESKNGTFLGSARVFEAEVPVNTALRVSETELLIEPVPTPQRGGMAATIERMRGQCRAVSRTMSGGIADNVRRYRGQCRAVSRTMSGGIAGNVRRYRGQCQAVSRTMSDGIADNAGRYRGQCRAVSPTMSVGIADNVERMRLHGEAVSPLLTSKCAHTAKRYRRY